MINWRAPRHFCILYTEGMHFKPVKPVDFQYMCVSSIQIVGSFLCKRKHVERFVWHNHTYKCPGLTQHLQHACGLQKAMVLDHIYGDRFIPMRFVHVENNTVHVHESQEAHKVMA